jgi:hypothetical protein
MSTADRPMPATAPPGDVMSDVIRDSPLPWEARGCRVCANGMPIADFNTRGDAAYAVAAANALPGLVEVVRAVADTHDAACPRSMWDASPCTCLSDLAVAALAALPEGVRPC